MSINIFSSITNFLSGINLDEEAQNIVDEVKDISEAISENNESNLTGQGSELPTNDIAPLEEIEERDYDYGDEIEDDIPIENPQDNICTNNPNSLSCDKEITDAFFAKKGEKAVPSDKVGSYTFNNPYTLLTDNTTGRQKVIDDIFKYLVKNKPELGANYANDTTKENIDTALAYEKLGKNVSITFDVYNSTTQETTSHTTTIKNSAGKYDGRKNIPTKKREAVVKYIVSHLKVPSDGNSYITTKKDVKDALTKKSYAKGDVVENIKLYKVIDDYTKITKANLGSKVYLVAKTKNFINGASVKFKLFENGDKLLSDYVNEENELPFLQGTNERTEVTGVVVTADVDNPETGNILEGRVAIEIALRPKKDKPDNDADTSANFEDWKKKFKKAETDTEDKEDKLYLKVSTTSYPEVEEEEFLVGDELVVKYNGCLTLVQLTSMFPGADATRRSEVLNIFNEYCQIFEINTRLRVAHFFAQVKEEVGNSLTGNEESLWYSVSALKSMFTRYFRHFPNDADEIGYKRISTSAYRRLTGEQQSIYTRQGSYYYSQFPNEDEIAKWVYCCNGSGNYFTNCRIQGGCEEGILYKGKGFIQLTWKSNYEAVNNVLQEKAPNENIDIVSNPNTVLETKVGLLSAMGFWEHSNLNTRADVGSSDAVVNSITAIVNLNTGSYAERREHFHDIYQILEGE